MAIVPRSTAFGVVRDPVVVSANIFSLIYLYPSGLTRGPIHHQPRA